MELSETAAILDAILNFSKRSTLQGVHPADSERVHPRLPKLINKNTLHKIPGFSYFCRTIMYRPPSCTTYELNDIIAQVNQFIFSWSSPLPNIIIIGDFNLPRVDWLNQNNVFHDYPTR